MTNTTWSVLPEDYLKCLGEMISVHSFVEMLVYTLFMDCCGLDEDSAKVIIDKGNLKPAQMKEIISALLELRPSDDPDADRALKAALGDYKLLTERRNQFAHWQWGISNQGPSVTNFLKQRPGAQPTMQQVSSEDLRLVVEGLRSVASRIIVNTPSARASMPKEMRQVFGGDGGEFA
ncbi:hypothetical protein [Pandoraea sp. B-6]|uniref:hypothetical protein n=1 Tax=Pandoraea sp. B-6 TaxID=1204340 RepID=UPI0012FA0DF5|nr:hypothetical protein [Pandoraea sp. B-6]